MTLDNNTASREQHSPQLHPTTTLTLNDAQTSMVPTEMTGEAVSNEGGYDPWDMPATASENSTAPNISSAALPRPLVAIDLKDFLAMTIPAREYVLAPLLPRQGLAMIHAKRGVGKTYLALAIAVTVAGGGSILGWQASAPRKVLYIDGEMPAGNMQERLTSMVKALRCPIPDGNFKLINADLFDGSPPNLSTPEGQGAVEPFVDAADLIVIDNIATLSRFGKENEAESWHPMQDWLLTLRRRGKSVLLVHHSNKSGAQRGTSSREDALDTVVSLTRPIDYEASQGARFIVSFDKGRGLVGADADSFTATMSTNDGAIQWAKGSIEDEVAAEVAELKADGMSFREIGAKLSISKSTAERALRRHEGRKAG